MTVVRELTARLKGVQLPVQLEDLVADARNQLAAIACDHDFGDVPVEQEARYGSIGHEILATARERKVDLIVMASHRPEMIDYLIGSNAAHVALHAPCSVMVLRKFV
jgi:nucleotide-binding universal stress UspA family protein